MIVSHRPLTSLNMSSYRAIWTHFKPIFMIFINLILQTGKSRNLESEKSEKIKYLKLQICSAQNVGKVWISRIKILLTPFGAIPCHFLHGPEKNQKHTKKNIIFLGGRPIFLGGCPIFLGALSMSPTCGLK